MKTTFNDEMIYEMDHMLNCGYEIKWSYDPRSYERKKIAFAPENLKKYSLFIVISGLTATGKIACNRVTLK